MALPFSLLENKKVLAACPNGAESNTAEVTFRSISLKYVHRAWLLLAFQQAASDATIITLDVGATVATATTPITFTARWWKNANIATNDTWVEQVAATTQALTAGMTDQVVCIEIDPSDVLAQNATFDCLGGSCAASGVANFISGFWILEPRYQSDVALSPSVVVD
jgi:hypothetical protein